MSIAISSDAEFYVVIGKAVSKAINEVIERIFVEMQQEIEREVYSANSAGDYSRTGALTDAWIHEARGLFGRIEFQPSMLPANPSAFQHDSPYGWDVRGEIFDILEGGYRAYNAKTGKFIAPRPWWDNFLSKIDSKIDKWIRAALRHQGLAVI